MWATATAERSPSFIMNFPQIKELCPGELNDFVLELVRKEYNRIPPDVFCRRKELCQAILACNKETGNRANMKEALTSNLKTWCARQDQIKAIERLGFTMTKGKTHYKIRANNSNYFIALASTPGDRRSGINCVANAVAVFF